MVVALNCCTGCGCQTHPEDRYCQECGKFLVDVASGTIDRSRFSDYFEVLLRLSPRSVQPKALPVVAATVALLVLVPIALISFEKSYSALSKHYICDQATRLLREGHPVEAAELMQRMQIVHRDTLDDHERDLLDRSLLESADQRISKGEFVSAAADLDNMSAKTSFVIDRLAFCRSHLAEKTKVSHEQQNPLKVGKRISTPVRSTMLAPKKVDDSATVSQNTSLPAPIANTSTVPAGAVADADAMRQRGLDAAAAPAAAPTSAGSETAAEHSTTAPSKEVPIKFIQSDVVRYNELLALYFTSRSKAGNRSGATDMKEPPALKEWIKLGKPTF